tara:strand:+ start:325 stop:570 length:246 start_codon:yes stop_codon:yes gene_type:complete
MLCFITSILNLPNEFPIEGGSATFELDVDFVNEEVFLDLILENRCGLYGMFPDQLKVRFELRIADVRNECGHYITLYEMVI